MARKLPEWIGKTDDTPAPPRVRVRIFEKYNGICSLSGRKIQTGDKWQLNHIKEIIAGGENRESNLAPVLTEPHKVETKRQMAVKKKVNSVKGKHLGAVQPKQSIKSAPFQKTAKKPKTPVNSLPPRRLYEEAR